MSQAVASNAETVFGAVEQAKSAGQECEKIAEQVIQLSDVSAAIATISESQKAEAQSIASRIGALNSSREIIHTTLEETKRNSQDVINTLGALSSKTAQFELG
jgi:methyl-accepting chemotaxis protein